MPYQKCCISVVFFRVAKQNEKSSLSSVVTLSKNSSNVHFSRYKEEGRDEKELAEIMLHLGHEGNSLVIGPAFRIKLTEL